MLLPNHWILELPVKAKPGSNEVAIVENDRLSANPRFSNQFFYPTPEKDGIVFHTPVFPPNGQPQSGTPFVSTLLRESDNSSNYVNWDSTKSSHSLKADLAITRFPGTTNAKMIVAEIKLNSKICLGCTSFALFAFAKSNPITYSMKGTFNNFTATIDVDPKYQLGSRFNIEILVVNGFIYFYYNSQLKTPRGVETSDQSVYFKVGAFSQNQASFLDPANGINEVIFYSLKVTHNESNVPPILPAVEPTPTPRILATAPSTAGGAKIAANYFFLFSLFFLFLFL
ncbi:hypothetical protein HK099_002191 [Clydaea vesicula]|uniref:Alginate lyase 2 domain-containing protein n=1 Tax=Clydaea vesicula TaxID=447962 RepID=A0AAD5U4I6_9FUNG|nr:hypothetical protein HK099_002191 [Clydaea vesicula]